MHYCNTPGALKCKPIKTFVFLSSTCIYITNCIETVTMET